MSTAFKISNTLGKRTPDMTIDWEFQPSLQHLVKRNDEANAEVGSWAETMPVEFDALHEPVTFREEMV